MHMKLPLHFSPRTSYEELRTTAKPYSPLRRLLLAVTVTLLLFSTISVYQSPFGFRARFSPEDVSLKAKVSLEAHIMSKCPDAKECLRDLVLPVMAKVSDRVDFSLSYIGRATDGDDGIECKHGPSECLGNILELCAASIYPDPKIYLGFTMCMTNDLTHIAEKALVHDCALEHGIDFDKLNDCASKDDGSFGMDLLRNSIARTNQANVTLSCTIRLDDKIRCIRDGGKWKNCTQGHSPDDLIHDILEYSNLVNE